MTTDQNHEREPELAKVLYPDLPWNLEHGEKLYIEDPFGLREVILPILSMEPKKDLLTGLASTFCTDPFGGYLTAQHVLDEHIPEIYADAPKDAINVGILSPGIVFGKAHMPDNLFVPVSYAASLRGRADDPLSILAGKPPRTTNVLDLMSLSFRMDDAPKRDIQFLPVRVQGRPLSVGETVMAVGYPKLMTEKSKTKTNVTTITGDLYGMMGKVTNLYPAGLNDNTRPWPVFEVDVAWPSGMSGGPVFTQDGEVVGVVSKSMEGYESAPGVSFATWFEPLGNGPYLPFIDPRNPGWIIGQGVFDPETDYIEGLFPCQKQAEEMLATSDKPLVIRECSHKIGTNDYVLINDKNSGANGGGANSSPRGLLVKIVQYLRRVKLLRRFF